jgi:L-amino acid N-acyltransferase YncA
VGAEALEPRDYVPGLFAFLEPMELRQMTPDDWPAVCEIYEQGIAGRNATFETEAPDWDAWNRSQLDDHRLVAVEDGRVVGWVVVHAVSPRPCYSGVVEHSVYVDADAQGKGIGRALLERLIADTEKAGIWTIQTGIFPENEASVALHLKCGFRVVGTQERLGQLDGVWRDVLVVERRSEEV